MCTHWLEKLPTNLFAKNEYVQWTVPVNQNLKMDQNRAACMNRSSTSKWISNRLFRKIVQTRKHVRVPRSLVKNFEPRPSIFSESDQTNQKSNGTADKWPPNDLGVIYGKWQFQTSGRPWWCTHQNVYHKKERQNFQTSFVTTDDPNFLISTDDKHYFCRRVAIKDQYSSFFSWDLDHDSIGGCNVPRIENF